MDLYNVTKTDFCWMLIERFLAEEKLEFDEITDGHISRSSSLGIAMEYLGMIDDSEMKEYIKHRSGCWDLLVSEDGNHYVVTIRDMLNSLPD